MKFNPPLLPNIFVLSQSLDVNFKIWVQAKSYDFNGLPIKSIVFKQDTIDRTLFSCSVKIELHINNHALEFINALQEGTYITINRVIKINDTEYATHTFGVKSFEIMNSAQENNESLIDTITFNCYRF